jgi:hydroxyacylglutathione hydrolase
VQIEVIDTPELGDRTYLVHDGDQAVVIDPQRDTERVTQLARRLDVRISLIAETHIHNDYVTGTTSPAAPTPTTPSSSTGSASATPTS